MSASLTTIMLSDKERELLDKIIKEGTEDSNTILRAKILQLSDSTDKPALSLVKIAELTGTSRQTVTKIRNICSEKGFDAALHVLERNRNRNCKNRSTELLNQIKQIISEPPKDGHSKWTIRSLASECIERGYVDYIAPPTLMRILHQNNIQI